MFPSFHQILRGILDLLIPPSCAACGDAEVARGALFCEACRVTLDEVPAAMECPLDGPVERQFSRYGYGGAVAEAIIACKHASRPGLAGPLTRLCSAGLALPGADLIIPVPLHRRRLARRGFNQAALIAAALASMRRVRWDPSLLARIRDTGSQGGLTRAARAQNVRGAFEVPRGKRERVHGRRVLLVDDVWTTGATCCACAAALRRAGAESVVAFTLCRVIS